MKTAGKEIITIETNSQILEIPVYRRKNAKNLSLCLKRNGKMRISSPHGISLRELANFVNSKRLELEEGLAKISRETIPLPEWIVWPPEKIPYRVEWDPDASLSRVRVSLEGNCVRIRGNPDSQIPALIGLQNLFRRKARNFLHPFITSLAPHLSFSVRIGNQERSMGSCSRWLRTRKDQKNLPVICLNWRISFLPPAMLRHVCWHELAHISHMNHSADFYRQLEAYSPDGKTREKELLAAWAALPAWVRYHA